MGPKGKMLMVRLVACLLPVLAGMAWTPVAAQDISQADRATIEHRIFAFDTMMKKGGTGESLDFVPPRLLDRIAKKFGVSATDFKALFAAQIANATKDVTFVSFRMDLSAGTIGITPDKNRNYVLIPTETVIEVPGTGRFLSKTTTLALKELSVWCLVRIAGAEQVLMLREAYPEFAGVEFPAGSTTPVD